MKLIHRYFPNLSQAQIDQLTKLEGIYRDLNAKVNVISRKDLDNFYERHVLHSLAVAKFIDFKPGTKIADCGTGGGFPGIPLAILFPECNFTLIDSVEKKIKVVRQVAEEINLQNVTILRSRIEESKGKYHFMLNRAVADLRTFYHWVKNNSEKQSLPGLKNGIISLKGGDLTKELRPFKNKKRVCEISEWFGEPFFETKKLIYIPF